MVKSPTPFLQHIKDAIDLIQSYIADQTFEQLQSDTKTRDAIIRQLEIIGEATTNLEADFKANHPEIPWRELSDFRNVLAHDYWEVDLQIVWKAATEEIRELKKSIDPIIENAINKPQSEI